MRGFFTGLLLGIILGAVGYWYSQKKANEHPEAEQRYEQSAAELRSNASEMAQNAADALRAKLDTFDLRDDQITNEMARTGRVFREKAQAAGQAIADAASDARAVTEIKAKYAADSTLSVWSISVNCNQGHVTLSGTVSAPGDIAKAVAIALDSDGVRDVASTLQVKPNQ